MSCSLIQTCRTVLRSHRVFEQLLRGVDHAATSTTKYRLFERYLGGRLGLPPEAIYTTYVKKPGNFDVRMTQSQISGS